MENKIYDDLYYEFKLDIVRTAFLLKSVKEDVIIMLHTNKWIADDINLSTSITHLLEMINVSDNELSNFVELIKSLEINSNVFYINDLKDEFEIIKENIKLEAGFILNMIDYMITVDDLTINDNEIVERLEQYLDNDIACYNQMKINNESLKVMRKERKDYFE